MRNVPVEIREVCSDREIIENFITQTYEYLLETSITGISMKRTDRVSIFIVGDGFGENPSSLRNSRTSDSIAAGNPDRDIHELSTANEGWSGKNTSTPPFQIHLKEFKLSTLTLVFDGFDEGEEAADTTTNFIR